MESKEVDITFEKQQDYQEKLWKTAQSEWKSDILPRANHLAHARASLPKSLSYAGMGYEAAKQHILDDIIPGLNGSSISPNYYGFVTAVSHCNMISCFHHSPLPPQSDNYPPFKLTILLSIGNTNKL